MHSVGRTSSGAPMPAATEARHEEVTGVHMPDAGSIASVRSSNQEPISHLQAKTGRSRYQTTRQMLGRVILPRPSFPTPKSLSSTLIPGKNSKEPKISRPMELHRPTRLEKEAQERRGQPDVTARRPAPHLKPTTWQILKNALYPSKRIDNRNILNAHGKRDITPIEIRTRLQKPLPANSDVQEPNPEKTVKTGSRKRAVAEPNNTGYGKARSTKVGTVPFSTFQPMDFWIEALAGAESGISAALDRQVVLNVHFNNLQHKSQALEELTHKSGTRGDPLRRLTTGLEVVTLLGEGKYSDKYGTPPQTLIKLAKHAREIRDTPIQSAVQNGPDKLIFKDLGNLGTYELSDNPGRHFMAVPTSSQKHQIREALNRVKELHTEVRAVLEALRNESVQAQAGTSVHAETDIASWNVKGKNKATD